MAYIQTAPIFADRYRFEPVPNNWDTGRTGYTYLVRDLEKNRLGVIKRADITSKKAVEELRNEVSALNALKGYGVPNVYETGQAVYESKKYEYVVIEYVRSLRIEENLGPLSATERIEILIQLFSIIDKAHKTGIANGDVDLKHLFWDREKRKLTIIDWGNAKLSFDLRKKTEYSFDLARSAEIIYSLTTLKGHPPATGSLALPNDSGLRSDLLPLPEEFRVLCKWAYRAPVDGIQSPYSAEELLEAAQRWNPGKIDKKSSSKNTDGTSWSKTSITLMSVLIIVIGIVLLGLIKFLNIPSAISSSTPTIKSVVTATTEFFSQTSNPTETEVPTFTPEPPAPSATLESQITPLPNLNKNLGLVFNQTVLSATPPSPSPCWSNYEDPKETSNLLDGFSRRDDTNWRFNIEQSPDSNRNIRADFTNCLNNQKINSLAMNILVSKMEIIKESSENTDSSNIGKGIGFFIEGTNNTKREYTIWVDQVGSMHLRVRENQKTLVDNVIAIVNAKNLKLANAFPRLYATFPIQMYLELDNQSLDILYLREGPGQLAVDYQALDPNQMIRVDSAVFKSLGDIKSFGLIGYGGETQTIIWPLVFYQK
jgi:serine/threonine protein kinase